MGQTREGAGEKKRKAREGGERREAEAVRREKEP